MTKKEFYEIIKKYEYYRNSFRKHFWESSEDKYIVNYNFFQKRYEVFFFDSMRGPIDMKTFEDEDLAYDYLWNSLYGGNEKFQQYKNSLI